MSDEITAREYIYMLEYAKIALIHLSFYPYKILTPAF